MARIVLGNREGTLAVRHGRGVMEALGEVVWEAQRLGKPLDNDHYLDLIRRQATRDR